MRNPHLDVLTLRVASLVYVPRAGQMVVSLTSL